MDARTSKDILRRLRALERRIPRLRRGVVTGTEPLAVKLGGAETAYSGVPTLGSDPQEGDAVAVLISGHELLVLGSLSRKINFGVAEVEFPGASEFITEKPINHGLGATPASVQVTTGDPSVNMGAGNFTSSQFGINGRHIAGVSPAKGTKRLAFWIAIG